MSAVLDSMSRFYCGIPLHSPFPLARFLPPYHRHTVTVYFKELTSQYHRSTGLILDPFGISPFLPVELANAGAAVTVCCNNPILRIFLRVSALKPGLEEFQTILAEISALRKFDTRLETFLRSLYRSVCNICLSEIEVDSYIWGKDSPNSSYRIMYKEYHCSQCGSDGQFPVTLQDQQRVQRLPPRTLIETQAASKVVKNSDPAYPAVIEILGIYPTRSLYAIVTLLNKLDELDFDQRQKLILHALLIGAFDLTNALWGYPSKRHRPKQLSIPNQYYEVNFWRSLEKSMHWWINVVTESAFFPVLVFDWPQLPRAGEISIFSGRLKELLPHLPNQEFTAIVTTLPRPNQAFWTLCAIWSGWLEGKEKVSPLKSALSRKRYDWGWHCRALTVTFQEIANHLPENTPCFGLIEEYEANFLAAALFAADQANLCLENLAIRSDQGRTQIQWRTSPPSDKKAPISFGNSGQLQAEIKSHIANIVHNHINQTLEPANYAQVHAVSLANLVHSLENRQQKLYPENSILEIFPFQSVPDYPNFFLNLFEEAIQSSPSLLPLGGDERSLETRFWWIPNPRIDHAPLSDQVEEVVYEYLLNHNSVTFLEIDHAICSRFGSITVPTPALVQECLESYTDYDQTTKIWTLRREENPIQRSHDLSGIRENLISLGNRLNYLVKEDQALVWLDKNQTKAVIWNIQTNAQISSMLRAFYSINGISTHLAIPGSRVNLILYKLQRYPFITKLLGKQIRIIRFRQIRWMVTQPKINLSLFEDWLTIEPIKYQSSQLSLL